MKTFVINLAHDKIRWRKISRQLTGLNVGYDRITGVSGADLSDAELARHYDPVKASWRQARELTPSEIGCALSHLVVYRAMSTRDLPWALVLEDDVVLPGDLTTLVDSLVEHLPADEPVVCLLSSAEPASEEAGIALSRDYTLLPFGSGYFASSYILTRAAAEYLLGVLHPVGDVADCWERLAQSGVLKVLMVSPTAIEQNQAELGSMTTMDIRAMLASSAFAKLQYKLRRARNLALSRFVEARWRTGVRPVGRDAPHPIDDMIR